MKAETAVNNLLTIAKDLALVELEKRVRTVLRAGHKGRNPARSFSMGLGEATFFDKDGQPLWAEFNQTWVWAEPTYRLLELFDDTLGLTNQVMRIDGPDEPVTNKW